MNLWLSSLNNCDHQYAWDGSGIAIDSKNKLLYLSGKFNKSYIEKVYSFNEVREWGYEIPGQTFILGNATKDVIIQTSMFNLIALENTGLWLKVKDKSYPKWFVKFNFENKKEAEIKLSQWMEILRQEINNE